MTTSTAHHHTYGDRDQFLGGPCHCVCGTDCTCRCMTCHGETAQTSCIHGDEMTKWNRDMLARLGR